MPEPVELRMSLELHHTLLEAAPPGSAVEARLQAADTRYDILPGLEHYRWFVGTPDGRGPSAESAHAGLGAQVDLSRRRSTARGSTAANQRRLASSPWRSSEELEVALELWSATPRDTTGSKSRKESAIVQT